MRDPLMNDMMTYLALENAMLRWDMNGEREMVRACLPLMKALADKFAEDRAKALIEEIEDGRSE